MGCSGEKEKLQDKMMLMKLERMEIQLEKEKQLKKLSELEGRLIKGNNIPDYIDPNFAKEKHIYDEDDDDDIEHKQTDDSPKKGKNGKKEKKDKGEKKEKRKSKDKKDKRDKEKEKENKKNKKDDDKKKKKKK